MKLQGKLPPRSGGRFGVAAIGMAAVIAWAIPYGRRTLTIDLIDVGQGDSVLVRTPDGATMLIDGGGTPGGDPEAPDVGARTVVPFLHRHGVDRIDLVVLTHPHDDHVGGLGAVLESIPVRSILVSGQTSKSGPYLRFARDAVAKRIPILLARPRGTIHLGAFVTLDLIGPRPPPFRGTHSDPNNNSVVFRLRYRQFNALFTGDIEEEAESRLMPYFPRCEFLKVAHHGSRFSTSEAFLSRVRPRIAAISDGPYNRFGHPSRDVIERLKRSGVEVFRTDLDGSIHVESDGRHLTALGYRRRDLGPGHPKSPAEAMPFR